MKGAKIGSALAAFESNIAKNIEYGSAGGKSFLTAVAAGSCTSNASSSSSRDSNRVRRHSICASNELLNSSTISDEDAEDDDAGYSVRWSPRKAPVTVGAVPRAKLVSCTLKIADLPFGDDPSESSQSFTEMNDSYASDISNHCSVEAGRVDNQNPNKKKTKKIVIVRMSTASPLTNETVQQNSPTKKTVKKLLIHVPAKRRLSNSGNSAAAGHRRGSSLTDYSATKNSSDGSSQDLAYCSPTEDTENSSFESPEGRSTNGRIRSRSRSNPRCCSLKSPLDKIAATLKRENSGKALQVAAQTAATKIAAHPPKKKVSSPMKRGSIPIQLNYKRLSLHMDESPKKSNVILDKSMSSLPVVTNGCAAAAQESFSSLPIAFTSQQKEDKSLNKQQSATAAKSAEQKGITRAARRSSIDQAGLGLKVKRFAASHAKARSPSKVTQPSLPSVPQSPIPAPKGAVCLSSPIPQSPISKPPTSDLQSEHTNSPSANDMEYGQFVDTTTRKLYPRSPMPNRAKLAAMLLNLDDDDDELEETTDALNCKPALPRPVFGKKTLTAKLATKAISAFPSDISLCTLDMNSKPVACPKSPGPKGDCNDDDESLSYSIASTFEEQVLHPIKLKTREEVIGILRRTPLIRNTTRRVKFADQQPGGGRRMSLHEPSAKDSLPMRPRRSSMSDLDRLQTTLQEHGSSSSQPMILMSILASTKIQAVTRGWIQWKSTRMTLLERKLARIEESRKRELTQIQEEKWRVMESIQAEIVEREKRIDSQVALAEKLIDHLKRDSILVKDQTKKLKEYSQNLKRNNVQLDHYVRLHYDNFATMSTAVELLREKSENLLASSKKYAGRVDRLQTKLEDTSRQVEAEFQDKMRTEKTIRRILRLIKKRCNDEQVVSKISALLREGGDDHTRRAFAPGDTFCSILDENDPEEEANAFDLRLKGHDNDDMSVFSDMTDFPGQSCSYKPSNETSMSDFNVIVEDDEIESDSSFQADDLSYNFNIAASKDGGNSFASYSPTTKFNKAAIVSRSDSFAEYNPSKIIRTPAGNAAAPARRSSYRDNNSSFGDIDIIAEEEDDEETL